MNRLLIHRSETSNKFWAIRVANTECAVNYGRIGSIGKVLIKYFDTEAACYIEAEKLIRQKTRKGYEEMDFDQYNHLYVDDPEVGPHPLTSHPRFTAHFTDDFYLDCTDEDSPFGNDTGADVLVMLEDAIRLDRTIDFLQSNSEIIEGWFDKGFTSPEEWKDFEYALDCDQVILASGFASIKIKGVIDPLLKQLTLEAIERIRKNEIKEYQERYEMMYERLKAFSS